MMRHKSLCLYAIALIALTAAVPSVASVDTSPKPGGVYRSEPGMYVQTGKRCASAPDVAIRQSDGHSISTAHTRACLARILSRNGVRNTVTQSCIDAGAGPASRSVEWQTLAVSDAATSTMATRGSQTTYRHCPADMIPADFQRTTK